MSFQSLALNSTVSASEIEITGMPRLSLNRNRLLSTTTSTIRNSAKIATTPIDCASDGGAIENMATHTPAIAAEKPVVSVPISQRPGLVYFQLLPRVRKMVASSTTATSPMQMSVAIHSRAGDTSMSL